MVDITVDVDQDVVKAMVLEKIEERIKNADFDLVFWDRTELMRRMCLESFIG